MARGYLHGGGGRSWRVSYLSVPGPFKTYCPVFFKRRKFKCNFHSRIPKSMYNVILSYATCPVEACNKAKRRQESGQGSSGGLRLLNFFRQYIIYSTAQLKLKKGTVRAKSRKCCESIYPNWMSRVVCPPSFSESRRQHQEPDGITEIGRFRQKFQVNLFFEMLQQFSAVGSSPRTRMSRSSCGHRGLDADGCGAEYVTALSEVKWREPATIGDRVLTGYGVDRDGAWIPARSRWKELESLSLVSPWACS